MSAFDGDPRLYVFGGGHWETDNGMVSADGGVFRAHRYSTVNTPEADTVHASLDEALRELLGDPQYVRPGSLADVEAIGRDR